jgi:MtrB/PioB family decaheme-associated outer membrane protein
MKTHNTLRAMALASTCLLPLAAYAEDAPQYNNEVDLGVRAQNQTSPVYGRYTGFTKSGASFLGGFSLKGGDAWDSGRTDYFNITGRDLNYTSSKIAPEGSVDAKVGQQGHWGAQVFYDAISYTGDNFYSPYSHSGALAPGLTQFGGASPTAAGPFTTAYYTTHPNVLANALLLEGSGVRRDIIGGSGKLIWGDWTLTAGLRHEHKSGDLIQTTYLSTPGGGNPFPQVVDYDTDRYDVKAAYFTPRLQSVLGYTYSKFTDNQTAFFLPYYVSPTAAPFQLVGAYGLPPSTDAHYFSGNVGYNISHSTRVMANARFGIEQNDSGLTPAFGNPLAVIDPTGNTANALAKNPTSIDQLARVYSANVTVSSDPFPRFDAMATYAIDGRQMQSNPSTIFGINHPDGVVSPTVPAAFSHPQSWTKQKAAAEVGYRVVPSTKLSLGYTFEDEHVEIAGVPHAQSNAIEARVNSRPLTNLDGSVSYEHEVRTGTVNYQQPNAFLSGNGAGTPFSLPFFEAPVTTDSVKFRSDYTFGEQFLAGVNGRVAYHNYNYPNGIHGVKRDYNASVGPDLTYRPTKDLTTHLFYNYEEIYYDNRGNGLAYPLNGGYGWDAKDTNQVHTVGLSGDWKPSDKLKVGADYVFSYGDVFYSLYDGIVAPVTTQTYQNVQNLPDIKTTMHSFKLHGEYELMPNVSLLAGYGYDMLKDNDWAFSAYGPVLLTSLTSGFSTTSGQAAPSYHVHSVYTAVRLKW